MSPAKAQSSGTEFDQGGEASANLCPVRRPCSGILVYGQNMTFSRGSAIQQAIYTVTKALPLTLGAAYLPAEVEILQDLILERCLFRRASKSFSTMPCLRHDRHPSSPVGCHSLRFVSRGRNPGEVT
jgi:hypothetical protein